MGRIKRFGGFAAIIVAAGAMPFPGAARAQAARDAANAATGDDRPYQLEEIHVTAQRRVQNVQDVPISISVVDGEALQATGYRQLEDIERLVSGVQYDSNYGGGFQIRGIGTQVFDYSTEQAVSVVVDEVVQDLPRVPGFLGLTDIARIEVLRGPQGTLFGKNSTAGVISVTTRKPRLNERSGDASIEYGERDDHRIAANFNLPLGDTAALRVNAFSTGQDGWSDYTLLDRAAGDVEEWGGRVKLLIDPGTGFDLLVTADFSHHDDNTPLGTLREAFFDPFFDAGAGSTAGGAPPGPDNYDTAANVETENDYDTGGLSLVANVAIGSHTLTSVTAYRELDLFQNLPLDAEPTVQFQPANFATIDSHFLSQEVRLASAMNRRTSYLFGLYYSRLRTDVEEEAAGYLGAPPFIFGPNETFSGTNGITRFDIENESLAAFGQVDIGITDRFGLTLGARITRDDNTSTIGYGPSDHADDIFPGFTFIPGAAVPDDPTGDVSETNFSYRISATYDVADDARLYATYSTGYKGPGTAFFGGRNQPYESETVDSYEVGLKSELFGRRLRLNFAVFHQEYEDFQAQDFELDPISGAPVFLIVNAGGLETEGGELEVQWQANEVFTLNGNLTYADSVFTDFLLNDVQQAGSRLSNAPRWAAAFGLDMHQAVTDNLVVLGSLNVAWRDEVVLDIEAPEASLQDDYALVNGRIALSDSAQRWQIGVYGRNLTDEKFDTAFNEVPFGILRRPGVGADRTLGVFVDYNF